MKLEFANTTVAIDSYYEMIQIYNTVNSREAYTAIEPHEATTHLKS